MQKKKLLDYLKTDRSIIYMCKIGDIIAVPNFVGDGNNLVGIHYFVVVKIIMEK